VSVYSEEVTGKPDDLNYGRVYTDAIQFAPPGRVKNTFADPTPVSSPVVRRSSPFAPAPEATRSSPFAPSVPVFTPSPGSTPSPLATQSRPPQPFIPVSRQTGSVIWYNLYSEAIQVGTANKKSILLFFRSSRGLSSQKMEKEILGDPSVQTRLSQYYICCMLDISQNEQICNYYSIFKAPVLIFLDSRGYSKARIDILVSPAQLVVELDRFK
jgi:hypothetical protein